MPGIICGTCLKEIVDGPTNKKYHAGECARLAHLKQCREYKKQHPSGKKPRIKMVCKYCKATFSTFRSDFVPCREPRCQNAYRRELAKKKWDALSDEEKKTFRKKKYANSLMALGQYKSVPAAEILCKCPGCGDWHIKRFEYGYDAKPGAIPYFNCPNHPGCIGQNLGVVSNGGYFGYNSARV